jgi:hypothetical protein
MKFCLFTLSLVAAVLTSQATDAWWEDEASTPLKQTVSGADFTATVNWEDGYLEVTGEATCDPSLSVNQSHCYTMALKAARALAYEKLAETVHGVHVSSSNTFQDEVIKDTSLRTTVQGLIKNARIISEETTTMSDGSPLIRVRLGLLINGPKGLSYAIARHLHQEEVTPDLARLRADFERAQEKLRQTEARADRLETLVQQAMEAAEESKRAVQKPTDSGTAREALQRAEAAVRLAEEAKSLAVDVAEAAEEAQNTGNQAKDAVSREEIDEALQAAREAQATADRLARAALVAEQAAEGAREAGAAAGERTQELVQFLGQTKSLTAQVEQARLEADNARQRSEDALARLSQLEPIIQDESTQESVGEALAEARNASREAKRARQEVVELETKMRRLRVFSDSLVTAGLRHNEEGLTQLRRETTALAESLALTKGRQHELEQQASACLAQATEAVEQATAQEQSPESAVLFEEIMTGIGEARELQATVASLEQRALRAEAEAARTTEAILTADSERAAIAKAAQQATQAANAVSALLDSLRTASRRADVVEKTAQATSARIIEMGSDTYTGLIVDASYLGARPAMKPRIYSPDNEEVYGDSKASREIALGNGYVGWADTPETARTKHVKRVGRNPLVVRAVEATGKHKSDLVVSREDALVIERADRAGGFLKECKVAIAIVPTA